ncbi:MAG: sulfite exporter TauE/SafE family protein, partial [Betaproteobacteria bacterium]|nr:sulfite exporter TauE/SafE family protein [Betaproteobacteria bacterium]
GARLAHKMPVSKLKRGFALLLFLLASYMLYRGLHT